MSDKPKQFRDVDGPDANHRMRLETLLESMNITLKLSHKTLERIVVTLEQMHEETRRMETALENLDVIVDEEKSTTPVEGGIPTVPLKA